MRIADAGRLRDRAATRVRMTAVEGEGDRTPKTFKEGQRKWNRNLRERLCGHWIRPTYPMHGSTPAIDQRIYPEMLSQRIRPAQP